MKHKKIIKLMFCMILFFITVNAYSQDNEKKDETKTEVKTEDNSEDNETESEDSVDQSKIWGNTNSLGYLAGYGFVSYGQNTANKNSGAFNLGFNPIFHYTFKDIAMLEAELEMEIDESGNTKMSLEYATIDIFLNDYVTLIAGRFMSPLGYFVQNLHPAWVNKLTNKPVGFGHDGAALSSETGVQLRGGAPIGDMRMNYAVYAGNGGSLGTEAGTPANITEPELKLEGVAEVDTDPSKTAGGRIGFIPMVDLEIGGSFAMGQLHLIDAGAIVGPARSLQILGADLNYVSSQIAGLRVRGEFVQTSVTAVADTFKTPGSMKLTAYYGEISYMTKWKFEPVLRMSQFKSDKGVYNSVTSEIEQELKTVTQFTVGLNYVIEPSVIAKIAFANTKTEGENPSNNNKLMLQIAFGF